MTTDIEKLDKDLLSSKDIASLKELYPNIRHDWEVRPIFRTETEARISVLNEVHFPTPHAKYWQSIREQQVHFEQLVFLSFDYRRKKIELEELQEAYSKERKWWKGESRKARLLAIDIEQKQYEILCCEKVAEERVREINQWAKIKAELLEKHREDIATEDADADVQQLKGYTKAFILELFNSGNVTGADAQNIVGKALTAINRCKELLIWDEIKAEMKLQSTHLHALGEPIE